jgi:hypothetical protein
LYHKNVQSMFYQLLLASMDPLLSNLANATINNGLTYQDLGSA